ncbi:MAG: right-handed parallel beta-helix repeat-containing protein, partial [Bacteroidales bacterium]|nr:right-handed parallel beta-helix repeat-containing protein [Bacteroidales bacterium]
MKRFTIQPVTDKIACMVIFIITLISLSSSVVFSQVTFTQTSDGDFNLGYHDNIRISGGNVILPDQGTNVNNWLSEGNLPQTLKGHQITRWANYVYLSGGNNGTQTTNTVYRASMQASGISGWTVYDTLPVRLKDHAMVATVNYIYIIGGRDETSISDKIFYAKINSNGTLGEWTESSVALPEPVWGHTACFQNGFIYVVGGSNQVSETSAISTTYFAKKLGINGEISTFSITSVLPEERNYHSMACYNNKLIVLGGINNGGIKQNNAYYSELHLDGTSGPWQLVSTSLPESISHHASACYNGLISVVGGENNVSVSNKIYFANLDEIPALNWITAADSLYERRKEGVAIPSNGQIVFAGGENLAGAIVATTRYASVTLDSDKANKGSFLSYPFLQLGQERMIDNLSYSMTYNPAYNNYSILYRLAGIDMIWSDWYEESQNNPVIVGQMAEYVQYMIRFDGTDDDNLVFSDLTLTISGYTQLSGNLNGIDTLKLSASPYGATGNISFTGGTHVVEAGVIVYFSPNTGLEIGQVNFICNGTITDSVKFTSFTGEPGVWNGIFFNTNSDNGVSSQLNYVVIEKGGYDSRNTNLYCENTNEPHLISSSLSLSDGIGARLKNSNLSVENCSFSMNQAHGIYIESCIPSFTSCNFNDNDIAGIRYANTSSGASFFNCNITGNQYGIYYPTPNITVSTITGLTSYNNIVSGIAMDGGNITGNQ